VVTTAWHVAVAGFDREPVMPVLALALVAVLVRNSGVTLVTPPLPVLALVVAGFKMGMTPG